VSLVGSQENEESSRPIAHVILNPDQAIPRFMVSYKLVNFQDLAEDRGFERFGEEKAIKTGGVCRLELLPSAHVEGLTPEDYHFRVAESQFFRMSENRRMKVRPCFRIFRISFNQRLWILHEDNGHRI